MSKPIVEESFEVRAVACPDCGEHNYAILQDVEGVITQERGFWQLQHFTRQVDVTCSSCDTEYIFQWTVRV